MCGSICVRVFWVSSVKQKAKVKRIDSDLFLGYVKSLFFDIPFDVYKVTACVFIIGLVILIALKGFKTGLRYSAKLLLIEYIFLLFCSTVIFRPTGERTGGRKNRGTGTCFTEKQSQ